MSIINEAHTDNQELDNVLEFEDMKDRFCPDYNPEEMAVVPRIGQRSRVKKLKLRSGISSTSTMTPRIFWEDDEDDAESMDSSLELDSEAPTSFIVWADCDGSERKIALTNDGLRLRGGASKSSSSTSLKEAEAPAAASEGGEWKEDGKKVQVNLLGVFKKVTAPGAGYFSKCPPRLRCKSCDWNNLFELLYRKVNCQYCKDPDCCPPDNPPWRRRQQRGRVCELPRFDAPQFEDDFPCGPQPPCRPFPPPRFQEPEFEEDFPCEPQPPNCCLPLCCIPNDCSAIVAPENFFDVLDTFYKTFYRQVREICGQDDDEDEDDVCDEMEEEDICGENLDDYDDGGGCGGEYFS